MGGGGMGWSGICGWARHTDRRNTSAIVIPMKNARCASTHFIAAETYCDAMDELRYDCRCRPVTRVRNSSDFINVSFEVLS
jgi:hypothetical protein